MTDLCAELLCLLQLSPNGQVPRILAARVAAPLAEVRDELGKLEGLGHVEFGERATEADDGGQGLAQSRVRITEAGRAAGGRPVAESASLQSARGFGKAGPFAAGWRVKGRAGTTAAALGLDPVIGGDDRLVILPILARDRDGATLADLADGAGLTAEQTYEELHPLRKVGYAAVDLSPEILYLDGLPLHFAAPGPAYLPHLGEAAAWITDAGRTALERHLQALGQPPKVFKLHNTSSRFREVSPS